LTLPVYLAPSVGDEVNAHGFHSTVTKTEN
jgi:hypothetical protein